MSEIVYVLKEILEHCVKLVIGMEFNGENLIAPVKNSAVRSVQPPKTI